MLISFLLVSAEATLCFDEVVDGEHTCKSISFKKFNRLLK